MKQTYVETSVVLLDAYLISMGMMYTFLDRKMAVVSVLPRKRLTKNSYIAQTVGER